MPVTTEILTIGTYKGCTMKRQCHKEDWDIKIGLGSETIQVVYDQWLVTPTGDITNDEKGRCYFVKNVPAISLIEGQDVYDENRILLTENRPAYAGFDNWASYMANGEMKSIILGSIDLTLVNKIPMDARDGYIITA